MAKGYNNKILRVNLTNGTTSSESLDEVTLRRFVGGAGFVTYNNKIISFFFTYFFFC